MTSKKLMMAAAILTVVALALTGVAYGLWSDTLNINGHVHTGSVNVSFETSWDTDSVNCIQTILPPDQDNNLFTITVPNAYPGLQCESWFVVKNIGSLPVKVHQPVAVSGNPSFSSVDANCYASPSQDVTLDPGKTATCCVILTFDNSIAQNTNYSFGYTVLSEQNAQ